MASLAAFTGCGCQSHPILSYPRLMIDDWWLMQCCHYAESRKRRQSHNPWIPWVILWALHTHAHTCTHIHKTQRQASSYEYNANPNPHTHIYTHTLVVRRNKIYYNATLHYTTLRYSILHYTTVFYTTLHYIAMLCDTVLTVVLCVVLGLLLTTYYLTVNYILHTTH